MMGNQQQVGHHKRALTVLVDPTKARLEHDAIFVAKVVGFGKAAFVEIFVTAQDIKADVGDHLCAIFKKVGCGLEKSATIADLFEQSRETA